MKRIAIDKASQRLHKAKSALARAKAATEYDGFASAWSEYLTAINQVYTVIEKGAKSHPKSRQWFGGVKKKECKSDRLIQYLLQARNADEHGLEPVTEYVSGRISFNSSFARGTLRIARMEVTPTKIDVDFGLPTGITITPPHPKLVTVIDDRFGTKFAPPTMHLGQPLTDSSPLAVGEHGIAYFERFVLEAEDLL